MDQYLYFPIHISYIEYLSQFTKLIACYKQDLKNILPKNITLSFKEDHHKKTIYVNDFYIINQNISYNFHPNYKKKACYGLILFINGYYINENLRYAHQYTIKQPNDHFRHLILDEINKIISIYHKNDEFIIFRLKEHTDRLLYYLYSKYGEKKEENSQIKKEEIIDEVVIFLNIYYKEDLSLSQLAYLFNISKSYLSSLFKEKTELTMKQYLTNIRILYAALELNQSQHTILETALNNGFKSLKTFNTRFKAYYHMTPSEYRKYSGQND